MNPILLQKQLKENASDLQDFCKELKSWGEEMRQKEESLKNKDAKIPSDNKVRKQAKPEMKTPKKEAKARTLATKIGVTDYAAWDKFDADAECEKLGEDVNEDSELTDECSDSKHDEAILEKEKGNKHVKNQNWDAAIKCYTKAIDVYSYDPIFFANRGLCYLKKLNFQEAENDCTLALKLDDTYVKAYQRRAAAREALNKLDYAEYDLLKVLELEPKNKESIASLGKLRKNLGKMEKLPESRPVSKFTASRGKCDVSHQPNTTQYILSPKPDSHSIEIKKMIDTSKPVPIWPEEDNIILVKPIKKPPHLRSTKPLKRIDIIEVDNSQIEMNKIQVVAPVAPEAIKQHVFEKKELEKPAEEPPKVVSAFKKRQIEKSLEKSDYPSGWPKPDQHSECLKSDDFKVIEKQNPDIYTPLNMKDVKNTSNKNISNSNENKKVKHETSSDFSIPKTSVQFYLTWKNLKSTEDKYRYLKAIKPQSLPKIFLDSLDSNVFSNILEVLAKHFIENNDCVFDILDCFTQVRRFGTFTIFMTSSDKNHLWKLFDYIKETEQIKKEDVDKLILKYEL